MGRAGMFIAGCVLALSVACSASDPGITTAVKSKLTTDDTVKAYQIDVDTREGVVTLTGHVESEAAKTQAIALARETEGVVDVVDQIRVAGGSAAMIDGPDIDADDAAARAGTAMTDASVTAAVKSKLVADSRVRGLDIDVDTEQGVVTLSGEVSTQAQKNAAVQIARSTENVKDVNDNLDVGR